MSSQHRTTLVVDDEMAIHEMYDVFLRPDPEEPRYLANTQTKEPAETRNFKVLHAAGGEEAIRVAENQAKKGKSIQVAFVDLKMQPIDGIETIKKLNEIDPRTLFVIVTGFANQAMEELAKSLGALPVQILGKPFSPAEIHTLATELCSQWSHSHDSNTE